MLPLLSRSSRFIFSQQNTQSTTVQTPAQKAQKVQTKEIPWYESPGKSFSGYFVLSAVGVSCYLLAKTQIDIQRLNRAVDAREHNTEEHQKLKSREKIMMEELERRNAVRKKMASGQ